MEIRFEDVLAEKRDLVWPVINKYLNDLIKFPGFCKIPPKYAPMAGFHQGIVAEYPERKGKYFRPTLVLLTASAMGFPEKKAVKTAAAMQTSEDWILIHDDLEDDSLERRGAPTLHKIYGKELAVNAGDTLHTLMWKMLWDNVGVLGSQKAGEIAEEFYQMLMRTTFGQTVEIKWTQSNKMDLSDEEIFLIFDGKTSYYTIAGPMRLGAILGGATILQLEKIYTLGRLLGRCFQIVDDLLDLTSDFKGLKKQKGNDIFEGKRTIMLMHLLREAENKDRVKIGKILAKKREEKTESEVFWIIERMREYGSLDYAKGLSEKLAKEALEYFEEELGFLEKQPARDNLKAAINFILHRQY